MARKEKIRLYMLKADPVTSYGLLSVLHPAWKHGLQTR